MQTWRHRLGRGPAGSLEFGPEVDQIGTRLNNRRPVHHLSQSDPNKVQVPSPCFPPYASCVVVVSVGELHNGVGGSPLRLLPVPTGTKPSAVLSRTLVSPSSTGRTLVSPSSTALAESHHGSASSPTAAY